MTHENNVPDFGAQISHALANMPAPTIEQVGLGVIVFSLCVSAGVALVNVLEAIREHCSHRSEQHKQIGSAPADL